MSSSRCAGSSDRNCVTIPSGSRPTSDAYERMKPRVKMPPGNLSNWFFSMASRNRTEMLVFSAIACSETFWRSRASRKRSPTVTLPAPRLETPRESPSPATPATPAPCCQARTNRSIPATPHAPASRTDSHRPTSMPPTATTGGMPTCLVHSARADTPTTLAPAPFDDDGNTVPNITRSDAFRLGRRVADVHRPADQQRRTARSVAPEWPACRRREGGRHEPRPQSRRGHVRSPATGTNCPPRPTEPRASRATRRPSGQSRSRICTASTPAAAIAATNATTRASCSSLTTRREAPAIGDDQRARRPHPTPPVPGATFGSATAAARFRRGPR